MVADDTNELHEFAKKLGLKRSWYQTSASYPHYDITTTNRSKALLLGAQLGSRKKIIECAKKLKIEQNSIPKTNIMSNQLKLF